MVIVGLDMIIIVVFIEGYMGEVLFGSKFY